MSSERCIRDDYEINVSNTQEPNMSTKQLLIQPYETEITYNSNYRTPEEDDVTIIPSANVFIPDLNFTDIEHGGIHLVNLTPIHHMQHMQHCTITVTCITK
jgi:hypothetical protein